MERKPPQPLTLQPGRSDLQASLANGNVVKARVIATPRSIPIYSGSKTPLDVAKLRRQTGLCILGGFGSLSASLRQRLKPKM